MYLWIALFIFSFFIVKLNSDNEWFEYVISIICRVFVSALISTIFIGTIISLMPSETRQCSSQPIYSLKMDGKTEGNFVLFFGDVNNVKYYYYYLQLDNGNKQYQETKATSIQVKNTDEMPPQKITYKEYTKLPEWTRYLTSKDKNLDFWGEVKYEVLVIPKNSIEQVYDGNIK